jgi:hypothetical protein
MCKSTGIELILNARQLFILYVYASILYILFIIYYIIAYLEIATVKAIISAYISQGLPGMNSVLLIFVSLVLSVVLDKRKDETNCYYKLIFT